MSSVGAKVLARNVSGNITVNMRPLTASTERIVEPTRMPTQIIAKPKSSSSAKASTASATLSWIRQPMTRPVSDMTTMPMLEWIRLEMLRPDQDGGGVDRQRLHPVDEALLEVVGEADGDDERREGHRLGHDPGGSGTRGSRRRAGIAIEPPKTKANSSTNITGWMVTSSSSSGIRLMWIRLRRVIASDWLSRPVVADLGRVEVACWSRSWSVIGAHAELLLGLVGRLLGAVAGEVQEHVVEARALQAEVVELDAAALEGVADAGHVGEPVGRGGQLPGGLVDVDLGRQPRAARSAAAARSSAWETVRTTLAAPDWSLSWGGVPWAMTGPCR